MQSLSNKQLKNAIEITTNDPIGAITFTNDNYERITPLIRLIFSPYMIHNTRKVILSSNSDILKEFRLLLPLQHLIANYTRKMF